MRGAIFAIAIMALVPFNFVFAAERDHRLFLPSGQVVPKDFDGDPLSLVVVHPKIASNCLVLAAPCIRWKLVIPNLAEADSIKSKVEEGMNLWKQNNPDFGMQFEYAGATSDSSLMILPPDEYMNEAIGGDFMISFLSPPPPYEITMDATTISETLDYIHFGTQELRWGGIFINSAIPANAYNLKTVIARELGRLMGMAPSATRNSILYPALVINEPEFSDKALAARLYPAVETGPSNLGMLSGRIIDGSDGKGIKGVAVKLLPLMEVSAYVLDWDDTDHLKNGALSRSDGSFLLEAVPGGDYVVVVEPLQNLSFFNSSSVLDPLGLFDSWIQTFFTELQFEKEFYDGKDRESNFENLFLFSALGSLAAATVHIVANEETSGVEIITNQPLVPETPIQAQGSSNESLSSSPMPVLPATFEEPPPPPPSSSIGGCFVADVRKPNFWLVLLGLFALIALYQVRLGRKEEWFRSESQ